MKPLNKFFVFLFLLSVTFGCFESPQFSNVPQIEFENIYSQGDTLIQLSLGLKDGDGNFGIPVIEGQGGNPEDNKNDPYNPENFFLENGTGDLFEIGTENFYTDTTPPHNIINNIIPLEIFTLRGKSGKLVTNRTRQNPNYQTKLPVYLSSDLNCRNYTNRKLHVFIGDSFMIDNSYVISDTIRDYLGNVFYQLNDINYFEVNPLHYNIEVNWLIKISTNPDVFEEYDWRKEYCAQTFDGRIPLLNDTQSPIEATVTYGLKDPNLLAIFGSRILKLQITVTDQSFQKSNTIETPEFTIRGIKR